MENLYPLQYWPAFSWFTSDWELGFGDQILFDPVVQWKKTQNAEDKHHGDGYVMMKQSKDNFSLTYFALLLGKLYVS